MRSAREAIEGNRPYLGKQLSCEGSKGSEGSASDLFRVCGVFRGGTSNSGSRSNDAPMRRCAREIAPVQQIILRSLVAKTPDDGEGTHHPTPDADSPAAAQSTEAGVDVREQVRNLARII